MKATANSAMKKGMVAVFMIANSWSPTRVCNSQQVCVTYNPLRQWFLGDVVNANRLSQRFNKAGAVLYVSDFLLDQTI